METKRILVKALKLEKCFKAYAADGRQKQEVIEKFESVWGKEMTNHFLWKYSDAESLIWAFDSTNLELFITKF